jgi:flagellar hook-associated protein 2
MVSSITLGTFGKSNGKNVITGGQSGLDTKGLIDGLVSAKRIPAVNLETDNKVLDSQIKAFGSLKTILSSLKSAVDTLRNPSGPDATKNIFNYRTASLTTNTGAAASNYVDVSVQPGAAIQDFAITNVNFLAQQTKQQTGNIVLADSTTASAVTGAAGFFTAGTVNLRAVDGTVGGVPITLNTGDSLQSVVNKFNAVKDRTGIQASLLTVSTSVGANTYKIIYSATKTGTTYGFDLATNSPTAGFGVVADPSGVLSQITSQPGFGTTLTAQNAQFNLDGVTVTRETNAVSDLLSGVTFNLKQPTAGVVVNASVKPDTTIAQNAIQSFVDSYNKLRLFASTQSQRGDDGLPTKDAVLALNRSFQDIVFNVGAEVSSIVKGLNSGVFSQLADVGIKIEDFAGDDTNPATKNILTIDTDKLSSSLVANFQQVRDVFENKLTSDDSKFVTFQTSNTLTANTFSVSINQTTSTYSATYVDPVTGNSSTVPLDGSNLGVGVTLTGRAGTAFAGAKFIYAATGDTTVNATMTHGIGDRLYNAIAAVLDEENGSLTVEVESISDRDARNKAEIIKIDDKMVTYREQLTQQYAALEAALSKANSLLSLLTAQQDARNNS